jgi:hypothetical protein
VKVPGVDFSWQMNLAMLREILYRETYDKSPNGYAENRGKGGGGLGIHQNRLVKNPPKIPGADFSAARRRISVCRAVAKLPELPSDDEETVVVSSSSVLVESVLETWLTDLQRAA